jgi:hypothetical protein
MTFSPVTGGNGTNECDFKPNAYVESQRFKMFKIYTISVVQHNLEMSMIFEPIHV